MTETDMDRAQALLASMQPATWNTIVDQLVRRLAEDNRKSVRLIETEYPVDSFAGPQETAEAMALRIARKS